MDSILSYFSQIGLDLTGLTKSTLVLLVGAVAVCGICRFIYRKATLIGEAVSSAIAVIFICLVSVLLVTTLEQLRWLAAPLPFVTIHGDQLDFFRFGQSSFLRISEELLSMIILAFLVNLADRWMPKGKNLLRWFGLRCLTVLAGLVLHFAVTWLFQRFVPQGIAAYAPAVLLVLLGIMLLTGALKLVVGLFLATVNPIIGGLYTFFFANVIGRLVTRAVLTTGILWGSLAVLDKFGITGLSIAPGALVAYIPFLLILIPVWYLVNRLV